MKAITLHQPWASLIASGAKRIETRHWKPAAWMIGKEIAIHAGKHKFGGGLLEDEEFMAAVTKALGADWFTTMPYGAVVATAVFDRAYFIDDPNAIPAFLKDRNIPQTEIVFGDFRRGRYMWLLRNVKAVDPPIPATGAQGFWEWQP